MFIHNLIYYDSEFDIDLDLDVHYEVDCDEVIIHKIMHNDNDITERFHDLAHLEKHIVKYLIEKAQDDKADAAESYRENFFDLDY